MIYIGIDPGQMGAIGFISSRPDVEDMPKTISSLYNLLKDQEPEAYQYFCIVEQAQPMPKQGVKGVFTYGVGYGKLLAILEILQIPYQTIHPSIWKKEFSLIKKDKKASVKVAQQLFPGIEFYTPRGRMLDGRAEALLLAEYARRKYEGTSQQKTEKKTSKKATS